MVCGKQTMPWQWWYTLTVVMVAKSLVKYIANATGINAVINPACDS